MELVVAGNAIGKSQESAGGGKMDFIKNIQRSWDKYSSWYRFIRICSRFFFSSELCGVFITKMKGIDITQMDATNSGMVQAFIDKITQGKMRNLPNLVTKHKPIRPRFGQ